MVDRLSSLGRSRWYWLALLLLALGMEGTALFYQYQLGYGPCVLCIHVRIWLLGVIALSMPAAWLGRSPGMTAAAHGVAALLMGGLLSTSWQLLGTERGWIFGSCNMDAGLPPWFALDSWFPSVFQVWESCGYTPELLFGVTMAEALLAFSIVMAAASLLLLGSVLLAARQSRAAA